MFLRSSKIVADQPKVIRHTILFSCIACALLLSSSAFAQSGRQKQRTSVPAPTVAIQPPVSVSKDPEKVTSLVVSGEIFHEGKYGWSNYLDAVQKEFINWMKYEPRPFRNVSKGGKMKFESAKERAKKETDVHVLWLGIVTVNDSWGRTSVDYIDYTVLIPGTARSLTSGRVYPGKQTVVAQGGVITIPSIQKRSSEVLQMILGTREIVSRLKTSGWF